MNKMLKGSWPVWKALAVCFVLSVMMPGCASTPPSSFYVLSSSLGTGEDGQALPRGANDLFIGVGPVKIPDYLDRVQIVTRSGESTVQISEFQRWSEPLDKGLERIIAQNLTTLLASDNVLLFPWSGARNVDYQVAVEVKRFEGKPGDKVLLDSSWTLLTDGGKQVRLRRNFRVSEPLSGPSYEELVSALSRAAAKLSREIATAIAEEAGTPRGAGSLK